MFVAFPSVELILEQTLSFPFLDEIPNTTKICNQSDKLTATTKTKQKRQEYKWKVLA